MQLLGKTGGVLEPLNIIESLVLDVFLQQKYGFLPLILNQFGEMCLALLGHPLPAVFCSALHY